MAQRKWTRSGKIDGGARRRYPGEQTRVTSESRRSQLPEPSRVNAVLLQLEVQGLVVGSEKPRRLALVPTGDLEDPADRLLLGVRCGGLGDLPQRGADGRRLSAECGRRSLRRRVDGEDREGLRLDHIRSEEDRPANDVPELPHIPRPGAAQKDLSRRLRDFAARAAELHAGFGEKLVRQVEDVIALSEGRQGDPEFVQTVIDILAEPASPYLSLEGDIGGGDDPRGHADRLLAAERLDLSFLQRTQELRLCGEGKVDDLIEEKASARRQLELPVLSLMRPRERALLVAEELRLDQGVRYRAAVDSDKRLLASSTQLMNRASDELLASARLALDENSQRGVGHLLDLLDNLPHLAVRAHQKPQRALDDLVRLPQFARALLDDGLELVEVTLQRQLLFLDPATQRAHLDRSAQRRDEVIPVDGLLDEVVGPGSEGVHHQVVLAVPGDHQGGGVGPVRPDLGQQLETVHSWHLDVRDDRVIVPSGDPVECRRPRVSRLHRQHGHSEP